MPSTRPARTGPQADVRRAVALSGSALTPEATPSSSPTSARPHLVPHPEGEVVNQATGKVAHASIAIVLWHYLLTADGTPPADRWLTFRELPNGLFYAQAFAAHAESLLADEVRLGCRRLPPRRR